MSRLVTTGMSRRYEIADGHWELALQQLHPTVGGWVAHSAESYNAGIEAAMRVINEMEDMISALESRLSGLDPEGNFRDS